MKPPQEQAEEIANKTAKAMWTIGEGKKADYEKDAAWYLLKSTALAELIAVAQVAAKLVEVSTVDETTTHYNHCYSNDVEVLDKTIEALRATGKVEI